MLAGTQEQVIEELGEFLKKYPPPCKVAIKINLSSPPSALSPKTDPVFLSNVLSYLLRLGYNISIVEGAHGFLEQNLISIGMGDYLGHSSISLIDIDKEEDVVWIKRNGRCYPLPKALNEMDVRIALPCATKRPGYLFSCNVKTFVGILPSSLCQNGTISVFSRPMIHEDLTVTISDLYQIVCETIPFHFYLNGGNTISEKTSMRSLPLFYCSSNPIELDEYLVNVLQVDCPGYLQRLKMIINGDE